MISSKLPVGRNSRTKTASVSVLAARVMVNGFERMGADSASLIQASGISQNTLCDPDGRVSPAQIAKLWKKALELTEDSCLGLELALNISPNDYGIIGYIISSSATIRDALNRLDRYHSLLSDAVRYSTRETEAGFVLNHEIRGGGAVAGPMASYVLAVPIILMKNAIGKRPSIKEVCLTCERPDNTQKYDEVFGAPLRFGCNKNTVEVLAILDAPIPTADPALITVLEAHANALLDGLASNDSMANSVRSLVIEGFPNPPPEAEELGKRLASSPRTIRRRLREEGTSLSKIVTEARHGLALRYLAQDDLGASEIAYLLGFSDPTAFHRAFRRWQGCTPLEHRRVLLGLGP